ncbi:MAG: copper amine oxidase N-terminal domain-containing protein [Clostridiales bacterium]|nr:MAG: copper amine oxidase N-terminal domain-containing protein [Clostridiales bacterium]
MKKQMMLFRKIVNDRTMLPARFVAENLGADVSWDGDKELVTIQGKNLKTSEDVTILITIGAEYAVVNGENVKLDSPAFIENDRTYTPIRFISEHLGASVEWLEKTNKKVIITKICWQKKRKLKQKNIQQSSRANLIALHTTVRAVRHTAVQLKNFLLFLVVKTMFIFIYLRFACPAYL